MQNLKTITAEEFAEAIHDIAAEDVEEFGIDAILLIPGVHDLVAKHYNNEAIERVIEDDGEEA